MKISYKIILLFLLIPKLIWSFDGKKAFNKEKSISKTYEVNSDALMHVNNKYGAINVYLWEENKISVQVNITVSGNYEAKVNQRLKDIDVNFQATSSKVSALTAINGKNDQGSSSISYQINYIIKIPKNGSVNLLNKYGNIGIDKLNGTATLDCKYGDLNLGQLNNKSNAIKLSYSSNSTLTYVDKLNLDSHYTTFEIQKANQLNSTGNYNNFAFREIENLSISSNYTTIKANSISKSTINGNYLTLKLGTIKINTTINSNYSDIQLEGNSKTTSIAIDGNYTHSKITCASDYAFDIQVALTYGSFKDNLGLKYTNKNEKNSSKNYTAYHLTQGKSKISINTNYGSVQLLTK